jgi:limonene-1,2-epoxide hydrolase
VRDFFNAIETSDFDALRRSLAAEAVSRTVGIPPLEGADAIVESIRARHSQSAAERFEFRHFALDGDTVLVERVEIFTHGASEVRLPMVSAFDIAAGRITEYRTYLDVRSAVEQMR